MSVAVDMVLVRHGPVAVEPGLCYGRLDVDPACRPAGVVERVTAGLAGQPFTCLWTSPSRRCRLVAEMIGQAFGRAPRVDGRLQELDFGRWEGRSWSGLPRAELDAWAANIEDGSPPDGETGACLVERVTAFRRTLATMSGPHVIVSHGGPLKVLSAVLRGRAADLLAPTAALGSVEFIRLQAPRGS